MNANESEKVAVNRALTFANLRKVSSADAVYRLFGVPPGGQLREIGGAAAAILEHDRTACAALVAQAEVDPRRARARDGATVRTLLAKSRLAGTATMDAHGRVTLTLAAQTGVEAGYGFAVALLHDPSRAWGKALRRCAHEPCRKFFLSIASREGGPAPTYCTRVHQEASDKLAAVERSRAWRAIPSNREKAHAGDARRKKARRLAAKVSTATGTVSRQPRGDTTK